MIGADRADEIHVRGAAHAGHLRAEGLGDLHGERAHAARRPVDEDLLPRLDLAVIAKQLESGGCRHANGGCLLEGEIGRLLDELILGSARVLGERTSAPAEDFVSGTEGVDLRADRFDSPRDIGSRNCCLWLASARSPCA